MESMAEAMKATIKGEIEAMWEATSASDPDAEMAMPVAAINVLADWISKSKATTMMELQIQLKAAAEHIKTFAPDSISLSAGCELFMRYATRSNTEIPDFEECKEWLVARSAHYKQMTRTSRNQIAALGEKFVRDGSVVLLHGYSRVVVRLLQHAVKVQRKRLSCIVTEGTASGTGYKLAEQLLRIGMTDVTIISEAAIGHCMERVDCCLLGAEAVVENGGAWRVGRLSVAAPICDTA
eukprot:SAG11_NODE_1857_length_4161_cov_2.269079_3_plen_238_part_00